MKASNKGGREVDHPKLPDIERIEALTRERE